MGARFIAVTQDNAHAISIALERPPTAPEALFVRQQRRSRPAVAHPLTPSRPPLMPTLLVPLSVLINGSRIYTKQGLTPAQSFTGTSSEGSAGAYNSEPLLVMCGVTKMHSRSP